MLTHGLHLASPHNRHSQNILLVSLPFFWRANLADYGVHMATAQLKKFTQVT